MSQDYGIDREKLAGMLPWHWVQLRMTAAHNYWICTTRLDGRPHAMPVWGIWLGGDGEAEAFYFSTGRQSRKGRNLAHNSQVVVHPESANEVVIIEGRVEEIKDPDLFTRFAEAYGIKYEGFKPEPNPHNAYYSLKAQVVLAWLESDFAATATRWQY